ncbi:MAG: methylated-DNA--[protein]-cysteine S-methyltransferase [Bdellovibrionaceae bacterium]|nr:methylated-DNA--[protein]-cysteine S-methyltransferase [Pseudobdellovibrionaceae bacterium]MDW8190008.1 methylated-DNA--[protein]-cysteine S-methyltransferase [Pseudobdellovibrionaceae bacterium]
MSKTRLIWSEGSKIEPLYFSVSWGTFGYILKSGRVIRSWWEHSVSTPSRIPLGSRGDTRLSDLLVQYFSGNIRSFPSCLISYDYCSLFQKKVFDALLDLQSRQPRCIAYAELARRVDSSPRAVGRALSRNPLVVFIPCHRVCSSNGSLGGYQGGELIKKRLLQLEGIF